jgi:hypothetical protein
MTTARITGQAAVLLVRDVSASIAYWKDKLGFGNPSTWGEPPGFAILNRDHARIMLGKANADHTIIPTDIKIDRCAPNRGMRLM